MIDFIGDIHGHAGKLKDLLNKLEYTKKNGSYYHPERKAVFVGDFIDRGPGIRETLETVRAMVEDGNAYAVMGNHEYNALCFHYKKQNGGYLREHSEKNIKQHRETILQFRNRQEEYEDYIQWFLTLPLFIETEQFRAVHACWDRPAIEYLGSTLNENRLTEELLYQSAEKDTPLYKAVEMVLKGREVELPEESANIDKDGTSRKEIRIRWWEDPANMTYRQISIGREDFLPDDIVDPSQLNDYFHYPAGEKPVFFGHYWLRGEPALFRNNIGCIDYSAGKGGRLAAYCLGDEDFLSERNIVLV